MRKTKITLIISLVLSIGIIGIFLSMISIDKKSEKNTIEHMATVIEIEVTNIGGESYLELFTQEYRNTFYVSTNIAKHIDGVQINTIESGDIIYFRIDKNKQEFLNVVDFIDIVSLKTDNNIIFSLSDYNSYISVSAKPARIATIILLLMLSASLAFAFQIKKKTNKD